MSSNSNVVALGTPIFQAFDPDTNQFLVGGKLFTLTPGGDLSAKIPSYPTMIDAQNETNANTNPVILDATGSASVVLLGPTKLVLQNAAGDQEWTFDNYNLTGANIYDDNGNALLLFTGQTNAQNEITISNAVAGSSPSIMSSGNDTNVGLTIGVKGTSTINLNAGVSGTTAVQGNLTATGNATVTGNGIIHGTATIDGVTSIGVVTTNSGIVFTPATTGGTPTLVTTGTDSNITFQIDSKGTGGVRLRGDTSAAVVPVGYQGQVLTTTQVATPVGASVTSNITSLTLPIGHWLLFGQVTTNIPATNIVLGLSLVSGTFSAACLTQFTGSSGVTPAFTTPVFPLVASVPTNLWLIINMTTAGSYTATGTIQAIRIA